MSQDEPSSVEQEPLPPLYAGWIREIFPAGIPREKRATCHECPMCPPLESGAIVRMERFSPDTKCCTRQPVLPTFLVGECLLDIDGSRSMAGRQTVLDRLDRDASATPLALRASAAFELMLQPLKKNLFGRSRAIRCPHYLEEDGGRCSIWEHRNSECATWFCKHNRGNTGRRFWTDVQALLRCVEEELAIWCAIQLGIEGAALRATFDLDRRKIEGLAARDLSMGFDVERSRGLWGSWYHRRREYYEACAKLVRPLSWSDIIRIIGPAVQAHLLVAKESYEELTTPTPLPEQLLENGHYIMHAAPGGQPRILSYQEYDPLELSDRLLDALHHFDGRPTDDVLVEIARSKGIVLEPALIHRLVDYGVLRALTTFSADDQPASAVRDVDASRPEPARQATSKITE